MLKLDADTIAKPSSNMAQIAKSSFGSQPLSRQFVRTLVASSCVSGNCIPTCSKKLLTAVDIAFGDKYATILY